MKWILVALIAIQLALINARPSDSVVEWSASSLSFWPQTQLLFPTTGFPNTSPTTNGNLQLTRPQNRVINEAAIRQLPWTSNLGLILIPYPYSYFYRPNLFSSISTEPKSTPINSAQPHVELVSEFPESTTKLPNPKSSRPYLKNDKQTDRNLGALKTDSRLISAVQEVNPSFVIENLIPISGSQVLQIASVDNFPQSQVFKSKKASNKGSSHDANNIKVEATGNTAAGKSIPNVSFGSYFLPYNSNLQNNDKKIASLILQPMSKAIVGNGGTAISAPISRAVLRKGVPTNVFFSPESVAIAGAGGKAHAQADLILDLMER